MVPEIVKALILLASLGIAPAADVQVAPAPARGNATQAAGFVRQGDPTIYVVAKAEAFHDARQLAAVIAHEAYHLAHGPHEGPAYDEQLRVLRALHAPADAISRVRAARELHAHDYPR